MAIRLAHLVTFRPCIVVAALFAGTLGSCLCAALAGPRQPGASVSGQDAGDRPAFTTKTFTYKTAGATPVRADVYQAGDTKGRPVVVWIHGGALIVGSRKGVPRNLLDLCRAEGYVLVSVDYRLAPEVKLPAIVEDVEDAYRWVREQGPKLFHSDPDRVVVAGGSAGGYLTLVTGFRAKPRPRALVAYWGYGDVDGDWLTRPSEFYRKHVPLVGKGAAHKAVGAEVLTGTDGGAGKARGQFYQYLRQNGLWTREVTGFDPRTERSKLDPYCPVRNVTAAYPPTLLVHGTRDDDVPYEKSAEMAKELARHRVPHELITVEGAGHGLAGGDRKRVAEAHERALAFIRKHLRQGRDRRLPLNQQPPAGNAHPEGRCCGAAPRRAPSSNDTSWLPPSPRS